MNNSKMLFLIIVVQIFLVSNLYSDEIDYSEDWKETLLNDTCFVDVDSATYKSYDFSYVLSNIDNPGFLRRRYIGIFGPNYRRIEFFFRTDRDQSDPYNYIIKGKSKLGDNIRPINGNITLVAVREEKCYHVGAPLAIFSYEIKEPGTREGDGVYRGILSVMFEFYKGKIVFFTPSDGSYYEYFHKFVGVWERYNSNVRNKCIFSYEVAGFFMKLPYCEELIKSSEGDWYVYEIKDEFKQYGWENYDHEDYVECWWK